MINFGTSTWYCLVYSAITLAICCPRFAAGQSNSSIRDVQARGELVQRRISQDIKNDHPLVAQVVVALCDNLYQGIVPVPRAIGNGQDPDTNLYWGAGLGLRTYFIKQAGWQLVRKDSRPTPEVLERLILRKTIKRRGKEAEVFLVAEAWDGKEIKAATARFLSLAAGQKTEPLAVTWKGKTIYLPTGAAAHLVAYVGHNGLMDFSLASTPTANTQALARSSVILACASKPYFQAHLARGGSHPLVLTTNLMAPEAYTLDAIITGWMQGESSGRVRDLAAAVYAKYQKCGLRAARGLFTGEP